MFSARPPQCSHNSDSKLLWQPECTQVTQICFAHGVRSEEEKSAKRKLPPRTPFSETPGLRRLPSTEQCGHSLAFPFLGDTVMVSPSNQLTVWSGSLPESLTSLLLPPQRQRSHRGDWMSFSKPTGFLKQLFLLPRTRGAGAGHLERGEHWSWRHGDL